MSSPNLWRRMRTEDDGQLLLLVLAYTVIAGLLVTVIVNVSKAYLYRRALLAAADGAARTAANQPDLAQVYRTATAGAQATLPISESKAARAVHDYVLAAQLENRFSGFEVLDVSTDGTHVSVTMTATVNMAFVNFISAAYRDGYPVHATASARSVITP